MSGPDDPFDTPDWHAYAQHASDELVPKIRDCAVTVSLCPTGETDVKFALELGLSIMMDKPIIIVVLPGVKVPAKLLQIADWPVTADRMNEAVRSLLGGPP